jgi:hypothetical protein
MQIPSKGFRISLKIIKWAIFYWDIMDYIYLMII